MLQKELSEDLQYCTWLYEHINLKDENVISKQLFTRQNTSTLHTDFDLTLWFLRTQIQMIMFFWLLAVKCERFWTLKCLLLLKNRPNFFSKDIFRKKSNGLRSRQNKLDEIFLAMVRIHYKIHLLCYHFCCRLANYLVTLNIKFWNIPLIICHLTLIRSSNFCVLECLKYKEKFLQFCPEIK